MGLSYYEDDSTSVEATTDDDVWDRDDDHNDKKADPDGWVGAVCALAMAAWAVSSAVTMVVEGMSK